MDGEAFRNIEGLQDGKGGAIIRETLAVLCVFGRGVFRITGFIIRAIDWHGLLALMSEQFLPYAKE